MRPEKFQAPGQKERWDWAAAPNHSCVNETPLPLNLVRGMNSNVWKWSSCVRWIIRLHKRSAYGCLRKTHAQVCCYPPNSSTRAKLKDACIKPSVGHSVCPSTETERMNYMGVHIRLALCLHSSFKLIIVKSWSLCCLRTRFWEFRVTYGRVLGLTNPFTNCMTLQRSKL